MDKYYIFDMDGVLVEYRRDMSPESLDLMKKKGYFKNLRPEWNNILAMKKLFKETPSNVFILTAIFKKEFPYSEEEKKEYCKRVFPEMKDNLIIVDSEKGETKSQKFFEVTGIKTNKNCFLIDDYGKNLKDWENDGGSAVKYLNLINNNHGTIYERVLDCFMSPEEIYKNIKKF